MIFLSGGQKDEDHDDHLIRCLEKAQEIGMTMNISKCQQNNNYCTWVMCHELTLNV